MGRHSILDLPRPPRPYRVDLAPPCERTGNRFERVSEARAEDLERAALIRKVCQEEDVPFVRVAALALAEKLKKSGLGTEECETLASSVYMGRRRLNVSGALWKLVNGR